MPKIWTNQKFRKFCQNIDNPIFFTPPFMFDWFLSIDWIHFNPNRLDGLVKWNGLNSLDGLVKWNGLNGLDGLVKWNGLNGLDGLIWWNGLNGLNG